MYENGPIYGAVDTVAPPLNESLNLVVNAIITGIDLVEMQGVPRGEKAIR